MAAGQQQSGSARAGHGARALGLAGAVACAAIGLGGCVTPVQRYPGGAPWGSGQGAGAELVMESPGLRAARAARERELGAQAFALASEHDAPMWRDAGGRLAVRAPESALDQTLWPAPSRPTLDRPGRVRVFNQTDTLLYFRTEGVARRVDRGVVFWP